MTADDAKSAEGFEPAEGLAVWVPLVFGDREEPRGWLEGILRRAAEAAGHWWVLVAASAQHGPKLYPVDLLRPRDPKINGADKPAEPVKVEKPQVAV